MASRRYVAQLGGGEPIDEVFLVSQKQLRPNRAGNLYLQVRLSDRTGTVTGMMWNANDRVYQRFEDGDYVRIEGKSQFYNGALQIIISDIEPVHTEVDEADFLAVTPRDTTELLSRVRELLEGVGSPQIRGLAATFFADEAFVSRFEAAPAGIKLHHAYRGGLLEHVCGLMELADRVVDLYPFVDRDLLLMGAFLHDLGKIEELTYERDLAYSDEGQLVGHIIQGAALLRRQVEKWESQAGEAFPSDLRMRLEHMIASHHGSLEFGSPRVPMTPEAVALHFLDNLDAKLHAVHQMLQSEVNPEGAWTPYEPSMGRKLYRGQSLKEPAARPGKDEKDITRADH